MIRSEPGSTVVEMVNDLEELLESPLRSTDYLYEAVRDVVRAHKRRMFLIVPEASEPPEFAEVLAVFSGLPQLGPTLFEGSEDECKEFIEMQVCGT